MFIKVYTYHVIPEREQELLEIQAQAEKVYTRFIDKQFFVMKSQDNCTKWMEVHIYKDEHSYNESIKIIVQQAEIADLYARFLEIIISKEELTEENYKQFFIK